MVLAFTVTRNAIVCSIDVASRSMGREAFHSRTRVRRVPVVKVAYCRNASSVETLMLC